MTPAKSGNRRHLGGPRGCLAVSWAPSRIAPISHRTPPHGVVARADAGSIPASPIQDTATLWRTQAVAVFLCLWCPQGVPLTMNGAAGLATRSRRQLLPRRTASRSKLLTRRVVHTLGSAFTFSAGGHARARRSARGCGPMRTRRAALLFAIQAKKSPPTGGHSGRNGDQPPESLAPG